MNRQKPLALRVFWGLLATAIALAVAFWASEKLFPGATSAVGSLLKAGTKITPQIESQLFSLKIVQAIQTLSIFLVPAVAVLWAMYGRRGMALSLTTRVSAMDMVNIFFLIVFSNTILYVVAQYSQLIPWPQKWITSNETSQKLTEMLLSGKTYADFGLNLFVVAVIPAFAEEFFFRGFLQRLSMKWIRDPHISIFLVSVLFSAIHFDPVMFIPRFLLGAMLGYLYYWSCSLWLPMLAHFLNNGQYVLASFLLAKKGGQVGVADQASELTVGNFYLLMSVMAVGLILFSIYFRNMNVKFMRQS